MARRWERPAGPLAINNDRAATIRRNVPAAQSPGTAGRAAWLFMARTRGGRWPMVRHDVRMLSESDRRAIYQFIHALGPKGKPVPESLPPWVEPATPYILVMPVSPKPHPTPE